MPRATSGTQGGIYVSPGASSSDPNYSYLWYEVFVRTYIAKVAGVNTLFEVVGGGPVVTKDTSSSSTAPTPTFGSLTYANGTNEAYDTDMRVFLYRTKADETQPYLVKV